MTLNGVMVLTMRYFTEFGKSAFQHMTAFSSIKLIYQKSASITHRAVKFVCVTKFTHSPYNGFQRYSLLIDRLSFAFRWSLCTMS